ncbi:hypothetical protein HOF67_03430, partial [Candidatus Peregrinibacteria bacterium]|nr:hypothetical protein [Candidatus Peregrinibacteria bacterium]
SAPEPVFQPEPVVQPEPMAESPFSAPEPVVEPEPVVQPEPMAESPFSAPEPVVQPEPMAESPFSAPEPVAQPEPVVQPEPMAESPFSVPEPVVQPEPMGQPVDSNLAPKSHEDRYNEESDSFMGEKSEPEFGSESKFEPEIQPESKLESEPEPESPNPFSAPNPFESPEDEETNELTDNYSDDNVHGSSEPAHKDINFEEGATAAAESKDPLTSGLAEESMEDVASAGVEVADVTGADDGVGGGDVFDEEGGFWKVLEEAGIGREQIVMLLGVLGFVVFVILFIVFGWYRIFTGWFESSPEDVIEKDEIVEEVEEVEEGGTNGPLTEDEVFELTGIVNSYIFGSEFSNGVRLNQLDLNPISKNDGLVGVEASIAIGQPGQLERTNFEYYISTLMKMENALNVDLYDYLSRTVDRRSALQEHVLVLNQLLLEAESIKSVLLQEMASVEIDYDAVSVEKDAYEVSFFNSMNQYEGEVSYNYLELFVEAGQRQVKEKAYFNAMSTLSQNLDLVIAKLIPRINDITLNSEALIKGVRVFEIPDSNIDAIILDYAR